MSMRNIKVVMECLRNRITPLPDGQLFHDFVKEVEAIERAAKVLMRAEVFCGSHVPAEDFHAMSATVAAIAKDAP